MADFIVNEKIVKNIDIEPLSKELVLTAGQKISDDSDILDFAQRTVPTGYEVVVAVIIKVKRVSSV